MWGRVLGAAAAAPMAAVVLAAGVLGATGRGGAGQAAGGQGGAGQVGAQDQGAADATGGPPGRGPADIPAGMLALYRAAPAAECPGLPWTVLAGIGKVETDHGRVQAVSSAGAEGPMQFMPATWSAYGTDGDGDGRADIRDPADAVWSAARLLCADGGGRAGGLAGAVYAYNHSWDYVRSVLGWAAAYASAEPG